MKIPTSDLVAQAFLMSKSDDSYGITTTLPALQVTDQKHLPKDNWSGKKMWVTPKGGIGGAFLPLPVKSRVVTIIVWAKPTDKRRQWGDALALGEALMAYGTDWYTNITLQMPYTGYRAVEFTSFTPVTEDLRRIENDPQGLARVEFDAVLTYNVK